VKLKNHCATFLWASAIDGAALFAVMKARNLSFSTRSVKAIGSNRLAIFFPVYQLNQERI
jgi:hypothetical protein